MDTVDLIIKSSTEFYNDLKADENGRYRSWEHCYSHFIKARESKEVDYDYLSLQLAFYLASWGMYRGSSFLLQKDYKVHIPVVKELLGEKYDALAGIECIGFDNSLRTTGSFFLASSFILASILGKSFSLMTSPFLGITS